MTIEQTLLCKLLSRLGTVSVVENYYGDYTASVRFHEPLRFEISTVYAESNKGDTPGLALVRLADRLDYYRRKLWHQALTDHVAEQRALQPLVQREVIVQNCYHGKATSDLTDALCDCFTMRDIHKSETTPVMDEFGNTHEVLLYRFAIDDVVGEIGTRLHALQSILDKIYADPVLSAKWTAYLERAQ